MLPLILYPHPGLKQRSAPIDKFSPGLPELARQMNEVMLANQGVGLAAPQIGKNIRLFIMRKKESDEFTAYVNPEITLESKKKVVDEEGCLSIPEVFALVERAQKIRAKYQDLQGKKHTAKLKGFEARVFQHEFDHIEGVLFIDKAKEITKAPENFRL